MPMVPVAVDSATLVVTSMVSTAITFAFCRAMDISTGVSIAIAIVVGVLLYAIGVIPIGLIAVVGVAMLFGILKRAFKSSRPPE